MAKTQRQMVRVLEGKQLRKERARSKRGTIRHGMRMALAADDYSADIHWEGR